MIDVDGVGLNRTFMELKLDTDGVLMKNDVSLNRTFMELKLGKAPSSDEEKDKS